MVHWDFNGGTCFLSLPPAWGSFDALVSLVTSVSFPKSFLKRLFCVAKVWLRFPEFFLTYFALPFVFSPTPKLLFYCRPSLVATPKLPASVNFAGFPLPGLGSTPTSFFPIRFWGRFSYKPAVGFGRCFCPPPSPLFRRTAFWRRAAPISFFSYRAFFCPSLGQFWFKK